MKMRWWLLGIDAAVMLLLLFGQRITALMMQILPDCPFAQWGYLCPACGGTRCVASFCRGAFGESFAYNPIIFIVLVYSIVLLIALHLRSFFGFRFATAMSRVMASHWAVIGFAVVFAAYGFLRNL